MESINIERSFNYKTIAIISSVSLVTIFAIALIGLMVYTNSPFNLITHFEFDVNRLLLGISFAICFLSFLCIKNAYANSLKKKIIPSPTFTLPSENGKGIPPNSQMIIRSDLESRTTVSFKGDKLDPVVCLPPDVVKHIFSNLDAGVLGKSCCLVSRQWNAAAWNSLDLTKIFPSVTLLTEYDWEGLVDVRAMGLDMNDLAPLDVRATIPIVKEALATLNIGLNAGLTPFQTSKIQDNEGVTILTIPRGLSLKTLLKISKFQLKGPKPLFAEISDYILGEIGDNKVQQSYRILIANSILQDTHKHVEFLEYDTTSLGGGYDGFEVPGTLEATTLLVTTYMRSEKRLFMERSTYAKEKNRRGFDETPRIGHFSKAGLKITQTPTPWHESGVAGVLRLKGPKQKQTLMSTLRKWATF